MNNKAVKPREWLISANPQKFNPSWHDAIPEDVATEMSSSKFMAVEGWIHVREFNPACLDGEPAKDSAIQLWEDGDLCRALKCGRTSLMTLEKLPGFPAPIRLGRRFKRWVPEQIRAWIAAQSQPA